MTREKITVIRARPMRTEEELTTMLVNLLQDFSAQDILVALANAIDEYEESNGG